MATILFFGAFEFCTFTFKGAANLDAHQTYISFGSKFI